MSKGESLKPCEQCESGVPAVVLWPIRGTMPVQYRHLCMRCYNRLCDELDRDARIKRNKGGKV